MRAKSSRGTYPCLLLTPQNICPLGDFLARRGLTVLAPRLAHEATLDFDLERIGLEWLAFVRQHSRILAPA